MQPREFERNSEIVRAFRYNPGQAAHILHHLTNGGLACAHFRPPTETIEIFSYGEEISITDLRHDSDGANGVIYPGDWIVRRGPWEIEIVPSTVFDAEYAAVAERRRAD